MSLDPNYLPHTPEAAAAADAAATRRRIAALERTSDGIASANRAAAWQTPGLQNGFGNVGAGYAPAGYYKDIFGRVYLRGRLTVPADAYGLVMFNLAGDFRPVYIHDFSLMASGSFESGTVWASATVQPNGDVIFQGSLAEQIPLDVIQFRTV